MLDLGSHYIACEEQPEENECICEDIYQAKVDNYEEVLIADALGK
jgi:hypothetical protein